MNNVLFYIVRTVEILTNESFFLWEIIKYHIIGFVVTDSYRKDLHSSTLVSRKNFVMYLTNFWKNEVNK